MRPECYQFGATTICLLEAIIAFGRSANACNLGGPSCNGCGVYGVWFPAAIADAYYTKRLTAGLSAIKKNQRSEEHTSELQSRGHLVCRLLLEKKNSNFFVT